MANVWDVLSAMAKYDGSPTAHKDVVDCLKKHGHNVTMADAWCTMTIMAALYDANAISAVGGYKRISGDLKNQAQEKGIWKAGRYDILPGDIIVYGKNGKPNHTELCVGYDSAVSGNYAEISKDTCARRGWRSRKTILGRVRPKYSKAPTMNSLQLMICAVDTILGVYGSGDNRLKELSVFGEKNAKAIQDTVNDILTSADKIAFSTAVYILNGRAGKSSYRKKRLGKYYEVAQNRVNEIIAMRGHSSEQAVTDVISGKYGKDSVRTFLLQLNGYDPEKIQAAVNERLKSAKKPPDTFFNVRLYVPRFWENNPDTYYGDESIFLEYDAAGNITHSILFDTGMSGSMAVQKLETLPLNGKIDAVVLSHDHGDHTGNFKAICDKYRIGHVYFPEQSGVRKYQKSYAERMDGLERHAKNRGIQVSYCKPWDSFSVGCISCKLIFLADADKLPEKDNHHFINNMSAVWRVTVGDTWRILIGGDLSKDGIKQMLSKAVDVSTDVFKFQWHSDRNGITKAYAEKLGAIVGYTQYHHKESKGNGRKATHDLLRNTGAFVVRNCEDGEIYMDIAGNTLALSTSKGIKKTFKK